jgi:hypothetical protein
MQNPHPLGSVFINPFIIHALPHLNKISCQTTFNFPVCVWWRQASWDTNGSNFASVRGAQHYKTLRTSSNIHSVVLRHGCETGCLTENLVPLKKLVCHPFLFANPKTSRLQFVLLIRPHAINFLANCSYKQRIMILLCGSLADTQFKQQYAH